MHDRSSVFQPEQGSYSPSRRQPEQRHESYADETTGNCALAPTLEHRNHSNEKQNNRNEGKNLQQHQLLLPRSLYMRGIGGIDGVIMCCLLQ